VGVCHGVSCRGRRQLWKMWFPGQSRDLSGLTGGVQGLRLGRHDPVDHAQDPGARRPDLRDMAPPGECRRGGTDQHQHGRRPRRAQRAGGVVAARRSIAVSPAAGICCCASVWGASSGGVVGVSCTGTHCASHWAQRTFRFGLRFDDGTSYSAAQPGQAIRMEIRCGMQGLEWGRARPEQKVFALSLLKKLTRLLQYDKNGPSRVDSHHASIRNGRVAL
jgi:hypothetical protein